MNAIPKAYRIPGEGGIWVLICGDMLVFGVFFMTYFYARSQNVEIFSASQAHLNQTLGALNTLVLLSSSWFVAVGVHAARLNLRKIASRFFAGAVLCGLTFGIIKVFEYSEKIRNGAVINTNDFYMYYYMLTGIHLLHVVIGTGVLVGMIVSSRGLDGPLAKIRFLESGASFWHVVDVLWIVLFAVFYLIQ